MNKPLIVITGASSGIGAGIARLFANSGYPVGLIARTLHAMIDLQLPNALCIETDIRDYQAVQNAIKQFENHFGPTDCLINNAGFGKAGEFTDLSHEDHQSMLEVNVQGVLNTMEAILPGMRQRKAGTIINISSLADRKARPNLAAYAATKAALRSLSESLRMANAPLGIRVCNVAPAKINTPLLVQSNLHDEDIISVEDMAKTILWIYEQPKTICIRDIVIAPTYYAD